MAYELHPVDDWTPDGQIRFPFPEPPLAVGQAVEVIWTVADRPFTATCVGHDDDGRPLLGYQVAKLDQ